MQITIKQLNGETLNVNLSVSSKIIDLKNIIETKLKLNSDEQILIYRGCKLENCKSIYEYSITNQSVINLVNRSKNTIQIFFKTTNGNMFLSLDKNQMIKDVKTKLQYKLNLNSSDIMLVYNNGYLEDRQTLNDYNIIDKSTIEIFCKLECDTRKNVLEIFLKIFDDKLIRIFISEKEKVIDLKKKIEEILNFNSFEIMLVYQSGFLQDTRIIEEYKIVNKSIIEIIPKLNPKFPITFKSMIGETITFSVLAKDKIIDVKKRINENSIKNMFDIALIFQGEVLDENKRLDEYEITEGSVIIYVQKIK